jgi:AhpD family alkylhydroperoxidase
MRAGNLYKVVEYANASQEVQEIYDETKKELGLPFVLNWFKCQGNNAVLLRGNWEKLKSTMIRGSVPGIIKQLIIFNVSAQRNCQYCANVHAIFANQLGDSYGDEFLVTENMDSDLIPQSYKIALNSGSISDSDFEELIQAGFDKEEIQELMSQADLVNMLNTIADISGIKMDNELMEISA